MNENVDKNILSVLSLLFFLNYFYFHFFKIGREGVLVKSKYNVEDEMLKIGLKLRPPCKNSNIKYFLKTFRHKNNFKLTILLFPTTTTTIIISTNIITIDYTYIKKNKEKSGD